MAVRGKSRWISGPGGAEEADRQNETWHILRGQEGVAQRGDEVPGAVAVDSNGDGFEEVIDLGGLASRPAVGFIIQGRTDYDYAGGSVSSAGDINGDGFDDLIIGAPFGEDGGYGAGEAYVVFGKAGGFGTIDMSNPGAAGFIIRGEGGRAGASVSSAGDINGDGFDDLIVGAPYHHDFDSNHTGTAYVIFGKATGFGTIELADLASNPTQGFVIRAHEISDLAGFSVSGAGDVNGDGFDDLIVGAWQAGEDESSGGSDHGEAYVIFGKASGFSEFNLAILDPTEANHDPGAGFMISAPDGAATSVGFSVSNAGDINADGYDDVIVGAPYSGGYFLTGAAYVLFGKAGNFSSIDLGDLAPEDGFVIMRSGAQDSMAGTSVSSAGDVNGDGYDDLIIGAPLASITGEAYVIFGKAGGFGTIDLANLGAAGFTILGDANLDGAGFSVSDAGDVNGDGFDDVIVGAPYGDDGGSRAGEAYVIFGKAGGFGTVDLSNLGTAGFIIQGDTAGDLAGRSVSAAGDINSDGFDDLIVGAPIFNDAATVPGAAYVIFGQAPTVAVTRVGSAIGQTIYGGALGDTLDGREGDDRLFGGAGDDVLIGGTGSDRMEGGAGNDWYFVDNVNDLVIEGITEGTGDRVFASVSYTLTAGSHVEILSTDFHAGTAAINLSGNELGNVIYGNAGNNILDGRGGIDTLVGFGGDDWYVVDHANDYVVEGASEGTGDRIFASVSYTLAPGSHIEIFSTDFHAGTAALNLSGNELGNLIFGNAGNNILDGRGGIDTLVGFGGDDWYVVDHANDYVVEGAAEGTADRIFASVSYTLAPGSYVEILSTDFHAGTAAIHLSGNELANLIYGNAGNNVLDGRGGSDTLIGFGGDDSYFVDQAGDIVVEGASEGTADRVFAGTSYTLASGSHIEILSTDFHAGTAAIDLRGNEFANVLYGNAGNNVLDGKGGSDALFGFGGADTFAFTTALGAGNVDTIFDFDADDTLALDDAVFAGLGLGALSANAFTTGPAATTAEHRIVYNQATGELFYDADGNGGGAAVLFASLSGNPTLTASDFIVI